jgi:hypothetical protein
VATIQTPDGPAYLWMGDEWNSRLDGIKGHDIQYWGPPLRFNPDGSIVPLEKTRSWTIDVALGQPRTGSLARYVWPQKVDPHPIRVDACLGTPLERARRASCGEPSSRCAGSVRCLGRGFW